MLFCGNDNCERSLHYLNLCLILFEPPNVHPCMAIFKIEIHNGPREGLEDTLQ